MEINVTEIQRLELKPGEILVVHIPTGIPAGTKERFSKNLKKMFRTAGYAVVPEILILEEGATLEVIRAEEVKP